MISISICDKTHSKTCHIIIWRCVVLVWQKCPNYTHGRRRIGTYESISSLMIRLGSELSLKLNIYVFKYYLKYLYLIRIIMPIAMINIPPVWRIVLCLIYIFMLDLLLRFMTYTIVLCQTCKLLNTARPWSKT